MIRRRLPDLGILILLFLLPLLLYGSVALGSRTLLPADILYTFEPYRAAASDFGVSYPQNHLLGDLILQNYPWKLFLEEAFENRELPLWDPYIFSGHPFLANGQHSALYPLSIIFYALPLWRAFGVFAWLQLGMAGAFSYLFARVLGIGRLGGLVAGITFQLSGFMVVSVVHPMIVAGASWLPFILAMVELVIQQRPALAGRPASLPWTLLGAVGLGCQILAGHAENTYFVLLVTALYAAWRIGAMVLSNGAPSPSTRGVVGPEKHPPAPGRGEPGTVTKRQPWRKAATSALRPATWLSLMVVLGLALGAVQLIPLYEVVSTSFRGGEAAASLEQVLSWAYSPRRLIAFAMPNFFGNPAHHTIFDLFSWSRIPAPNRGDGQYVYWGIKNYVEGGAYLGLLPLMLSAIALVAWVKRRIRSNDVGAESGRSTIPFFALLALFSLGCIFGTPVYAVVYALPFLRQSHSPFRWVFPLTLAVSVLAGLGAQVVQRSREKAGLQRGERASQAARRQSPAKLLLLGQPPSLVSVTGSLAICGGAAALVGVILSRAFFVQIEPLVERVYLSLAGAPEAFPGHRAFFSYEALWVALFGLLLLGSGIVLRVSRCPVTVGKRPIWEFAAVGLVVIDFVSFGHGFHSVVNPALLDYVPPVVRFLQEQETPWRYATFTPPGTSATMKANTGMLHDLACVAGYDSLFTAQYRDTMALIEEQDQVAYNRIAPFRSWSSLDSPLTDLLNVKYILTEVEIPNPKYALVYEDEAVRVYQNLDVLPRAFTLPTSSTVETKDMATAVQTRDPRHYVLVDRETADGRAGAVRGGYARGTDDTQFHRQ